MVRQILKFNAVPALVILVLAAVLPGRIALSLALGYLLAAAFILSGAWIHKRLLKPDGNHSLKLFYRSKLLRFLLIIVLLIVILKSSDIHQISFTISLLISYLYNSVTELILFNQVFTKKSKST